VHAVAPTGLTGAGATDAHRDGVHCGGGRLRGKRSGDGARLAQPVLAQVLAETRLRLLSWYQETADVVAFDADRRDFG